MTKQEIDQEILGNHEYIEKWEQKNGTVESHIPESVCVNCEKKYTKTRPIIYVCCHNGELRWWHKMPFNESCIIYA